MAEQFKIRYGSASLDLTKSEHLVAVESSSLSPSPREFSPVSPKEVSPKKWSPKNIEAKERWIPFSHRTHVGKYVIMDLEEAKPQQNEMIIKEDSGFASSATFTSVYHSSNDMVPFVPTGSIYLEFAEGVSDSSKKELMSRHRLALRRKENDGAFTLLVTAGDAVELVASLQQEPIVRVAEPDLVTEAELKNFTLPNDALLSQQWYLENKGQIADVSTGLKAGADARVVAAWRFMQGFGLPEVVIGIIDDGFDLSHPDLAPRAIHPWDFKRNTSEVKPEPNRTSPATGDWHGTACAGIAVGALGGGKIIGAAPNCSWMPVRWSDLEPTEVVRWFEYMEMNGASVISCSWGSRAKNYPLSTRISKSIAHCAKQGRNGRGCIIVFAAGNEARDVDDPDNDTVNGWAIHPDVIAVSASSSMDERALYSNYGKAIWVCAPSSGAGWDVTTSDVVGEFVDSIGVSRSLGYVPGDYNEHFGKTSAACPLVAGICGLILSVNSQVTAEDVRSILKNTARPIGDPSLYDTNGHSMYFGYGCVDAEAAVVEAKAMVVSA